MRLVYRLQPEAWQVWLSTEEFRLSALSIAAAGMNAAATRFERNAANITRAGAGTPEGQGVDIGAEMVDMMINQNQFSVLASVAKRAGDMMKTGIDILA